MRECVGCVDFWALELVPGGIRYSRLETSTCPTSDSWKNLLKRYLALVSRGRPTCLFTRSCPCLFPHSCPAPLLVLCSMFRKCLRPCAYTCRLSCLFHPRTFEKDLRCLSWTALALHALIVAGADPTADLRLLMLRHRGAPPGAH